MESNKFLVGLFDHEDNMITAIRALKKAGISITDAMTPFPVHGLEHELGYEDSRLHRAGFFFGLTGMTVALSIMTWISTSSYPLNIGGKPHFSLPSFIPITFELTVLFAAVGMVIVYCIRNGLFPGNVPRIFDERITDDRFALTFSLDTDEYSDKDLKDILGILNSAGAVDIKTKEFEEDGEIFEVSTSDFAGATVTTSTVTTSTPEVMPQEAVIETASEEAMIADLKFVVGEVEEGRRDDLKIIKGIGPVYEGKLNDLGIFTFEQIAKLNDRAKHAVEQLTGFPGRVDRENWIGQAKELMNK